MPYDFHHQQWLPFPRAAVFAFFADPGNLPPLMPGWQSAEIEEAVIVPPVGAAKQVAGTGSKITLSFRPFLFSPFRLRWLAVIEDFELNRSFADVQMKGPFASWRHRHSFSREDRDGREGTRLLDEVSYEPPLGVLGTIANSLFIRAQLRTTFAHRHRRALELLQERIENRSAIRSVLPGPGPSSS